MVIALSWSIFAQAWKADLVAILGNRAIWGCSWTIFVQAWTAAAASAGLHERMNAYMNSQLCLMFAAVKACPYACKAFFLFRVRGSIMFSHKVVFQLSIGRAYAGCNRLGCKCCKVELRPICDLQDYSREAAENLLGMAACPLQILPQD